MNLAIYLTGSALILIALFRAMTTNTPPPPEPKHGDGRIILDTGAYWVQQYIKYPGWTHWQRFNTLEEAQKHKELWDSIHDKTIEDFKVIE
mgnify:CR=1 FL=1